MVAAGSRKSWSAWRTDIRNRQRLFNIGIDIAQLVTGGEAVVDAARRTYYRRPDRPPVAGNPRWWWIADRRKPAARCTSIKGASFCAGIICADEKVLIVVDSVADELMRLMEGPARGETDRRSGRTAPAGAAVKNIDERSKGTVSRTTGRS